MSVVERAHGVDRRRQLRGDREQVVDEARVGDGAQAVADVGAAEPSGVGLALHLVADTDEPLAAPRLAQGGQRVGHVLGREVDPAHDAGDQLVVGREDEQLGRLLGNGDRLDEHGGVDADRTRDVGELVDGERPAQRRERRTGDPRLVAHREIPEVVVGVNARNVQCLPQHSSDV